jgi:hypothetical protein
MWWEVNVRAADSAYEPPRNEITPMLATKDEDGGEV